MWVMRLFILVSAATLCVSAANNGNPIAKTANGTLEGTLTADSAIRVFRGIPFAQPPVGQLRWKAPQPPANWSGVRPAAKFGPRCMQHALFGDMNFRSDGMSEDCLYLNVWTPAKSAREKLPVLVYFFGGGFMAGDGSEPRYDGESMARKGIVAITVSYRLGVYGFLAHPELTQESPNRASGNYTVMDHTAALQWVQKNIAAFGGDPKRVTIAGESAGSIAVSAQMATPLAKGLFAGAIGESGSLLGALPPVPLAEAEKMGVRFAEAVKAPNLAALRAMTAEQIQEATKAGGAGAGVGRFSMTIDGYVLPEAPVAIFAAGKQAHVPLLAGWNSEEMNARAVLGRDEPTPEGFAKALARLYPANAAEVLKAYESADVLQSATDLASDRFISYSTWKWTDVAARTGGGKPVYRYYYSRPRPAMRPEMGNATAGLAGGVVRGNNASAPRPPAPRGAVHSAEIEYAMGNLSGNTVYAWTDDDRTVSATMQEYFANFIKHGNPNGKGLPEWPALSVDGSGNKVMRIDVKSGAEPETTRARYLLLDRLAGAAR